MNQRDQLIEKYARDLQEKFDEHVNMELLRAITIGLGPSIYNRDSSNISSSEQSELERVKENFLKGKLGLNPETDFESPLNKILEAYGRTNRTKYRAVVYYLLVKHFGCESVYIN